MRQEIDIRRTMVNRLIVMIDCFLVVSQSMEGTSKTIFNAPVLLEVARVLLFFKVLHLLCQLKVVDCILVIALSMLAHAPSIVPLSQLGKALVSVVLTRLCCGLLGFSLLLLINLNGIVEVINS